MKRKLIFAMLCIVSVLGLRAQTWTGNDVAAGDFYLYNVGAGQFLTSGNSWGTQASLTPAGGFLITLEGSDVTYALKVTETRTNNKAAGPGYVGTGGFMDAESAANWTFTKVEQGGVTAYRITTGANALKYSGSGTVVNVGADDTDNSLWVLVSKQDRLDAMAAADEDHPVDATFLLKNPDFGRYKLPAYDNAWTWTFPGNTNKNNSGDNTNFCIESYHVAFDFCQTVANAPYGNYGVKGQAFYRQDGTDNTNLPYFYVNDSKVTFPAKAGSENSMGDASASFTGGSYWSSVARTTFAGGSLVVGAHLNTNTSLWCIWDNIQLLYYGPIDLSEYETQLASAVTAAQAYESQLPAAVYANISSVITANNKAWATADEYATAITAINSAVSTYATADIIANYTRYNNIKTAALAIAAGISTTAADADVAAATTNDGINAAIATLRAAFLAKLPELSIPVDPGYIDVTAVMVDNASVATNTNYWTIEGTPNGGYSWGVCNYGECEFYQQNFKFYQTLALSTGTWEFGVTGFHRAGSHNTNFYAGEDKILIPGVESSVVNSMAQAQTYFNNGNGKVALKFLIEEAGDVEIGIHNQDTQTDKWTIFRDFTLKYYGAPDYSIYETQLADAVTAAEAVNGTVPTAVYSTLSGVVTENNQSYSKKADWIAAIQAIQDATTTASAMQAPYASYNAIKTAVLAISGSLDVSAAQTAADAATTSDALATATEQLRTALKTYLATTDKSDVDLTAALLINPSFENGFSSGWTNNGMAIQSNASFGKDGTNYCEKWEPSGTFGVSQTLAAMPSGVYRITAHAKARGVTSAKIYAAGFETAITVADSESDYTVQFAIDANTDIVFGFEGIGTGVGASWLCVDNFQLTLVSAGLPDVVAVTGNMNADVADAQTTAINTYNANKTIANYNAAVEAIAHAQASKDAYALLGTAITAIDAVLTAATTATAAADDYNAIKTAYTNGTIADGAITAQINAAYDAIIPVIKSQTAETANFTYAVRNHSFEYGDLTGWTVTASDDTGARETSNPTYATTGSDGKYLFNTWSKGNPITQTITDLPNGQYTMTASVASDGATIYLVANGEHNEGTETGGTYPDKDTFQDATITFLVKDGNATIGVVGGAAGTAGEHKDYVAEGHWWYKADNIRLVKNRDLTSEEAAVIPTAIALKIGDDVVSAPVALDKTTSTVTLTPSYTPGDATPSVTWETSDATVATVADGVVTAVSTGTATITVTSTLDGSVSATATINVTFPEMAEATHEVINEAAMEKTVYTLGDNIIKNGSFEYPDAYYGWTVGNGNKMTSAQFTVEEDGGNKYIQSVLHNGSNSAGALRQAWPIEAGKKYLFGYKLKNVSGTQVNNNEWFRVSLCNANPTAGDGTVITQYPSYNGAWTDYAVVVDNTESSYTFVQAHFRWLGDGSEHTAFDDFFLAEITNTEVIDLKATSSDYAALNAAMSGKTIGFEDGEYAPYNNVAAAAALAAAQAINQSEDNLASVVQAATAALTSATWTVNVGEQNAIYDGTFAAATNDGAPAGWITTHSAGLGSAYHARTFVLTSGMSNYNNLEAFGQGDGTRSAFYIRFDGTNSDQGTWYKYGETTNYTMPLKAETTYYISMQAGAWGDYANKNLSVTVKDPSGTSIVSTTIKTTKKTSNGQGVDNLTYVFTTTTAGNYTLNLWNANGSNYAAIVSNIELYKATVINENATYAAVAGDTKMVQLTRTIKAEDKWNTIVLPFDVNNTDLKAAFGNDVQVAEFSEVADGTSSTINFATMATPAIKANKPVLLKTSTAGTVYTFRDRSIEDGEAKATGNGNFNFIGTYAASFTVPANDYFISSNTLYKSKGTTTLKGTRAYLENLGATEVKMFIDDLETSINGLMADDEENGPVYNLAGQRVQKAQKGIFVKNGRKVVVK